MAKNKESNEAYKEVRQYGNALEMEVVKVGFRQASANEFGKTPDEVHFAHGNQQQAAA